MKTRCSEQPSCFFLLVLDFTTKFKSCVNLKIHCTISKAMILFPPYILGIILQWVHKNTEIGETQPLFLKMKVYIKASTITEDNFLIYYTLPYVLLYWSTIFWYICLFHIGPCLLFFVFILLIIMFVIIYPNRVHYAFWPKNEHYSCCNVFIFTEVKIPHQDKPQGLGGSLLIMSLLSFGLSRSKKQARKINIKIKKYSEAGAYKTNM